MKAIRLDEVGPPENLKLVDIPIPEIDEDGILVKVECAGLTYADTEFRRGTYYLQTQLPYFPGMYTCFRTGPVSDVTKTFSLTEAPAAHTWIDSGKVMGKIAFKI